MTDADLISLATEATSNAYAPYSNALVGCALIAESGAIYRGCNVENASYGLTICAERNAIFAAVACEGKAFRIARLAVVARGLEFPPCGACRQVIAEFASGDARVSFLQNGSIVTMRVTELLPATFSFQKP